MGLFDQFPYTNFHELNLNWILQRMMDLSNIVENFVTLNTIKYADPIQWNISTQYETNTVVIDPATGTAYISVKPVPSGVDITNSDYWTPVFDLNIAATNHNITLRDDGNNVLSTFTSNAGDWVIWKDTLYKVTQAIGLSQAYLPGYNIERYTVELFIKDYISNIINIIGDLNDLDTTVKTNIVAALNELVSVIGDLNDLTTADKTSVVNAINELVSVIGDLNDLTTTDKTSVVNAIIELVSDIGNLNDLTTADKTSVVNAIIELVSNIGNLNDLTTADKTSVVNAIIELVSNIGDLNDLTTTDKTSVVNAINELVSSAYEPIEKTVETVTDLIALDCAVGDIVKTLGYYVKGDAGSATYKIVSASQVGAEALTNGLYAIIVDNILRPEMFGCVCNGVTDDYTNFNKAVQYATNHRTPLYIYNNIAINGTITLVSWLSIIGATDGGTIDQLGDHDIFYINNTHNLDFCVIKNLRLRGTNKQGRGFNFDNTGGSTNYGSRNCDICNLDMSNLGIAIRLTSPWLVMRFHDITINNCGNGIFWGGHDGTLENFEISGCSGAFGGLMIQGGYNKFSNGKVYFCNGTLYGGVSLMQPATCKGNMLNNIDVQDNGRIGLQISTNSNTCIGISASDNNTDQLETSTGILCNGNYNVIIAAASNVNRGNPQNYGLSIAGQYNDIVMTSNDQTTANMTGVVGNNYIRINGVVAT